MNDSGKQHANLGSDSMRTSPTKTRYKILILLMAFTGLCHFNRISISVAGTEHIMKDFAITETQMGMVYSAYLFLYTLCMIPGGWFIDRFGPKRALMLVGFGSAILVPFTGLTSYLTAASILAVLCVIRGLLGIISAPIHPAAARAVSFWVAHNARGTANGLVTGAAVTGVASTYFVFGFLMDHVGWPSAFLIAGVVTLLLTIVWTIFATDHPRQHPLVNSHEQQLIEQGDLARTAPRDRVLQPSTNPFVDVLEQPKDAVELDTQSGFLSLLGNRNLVLLTISYATASYFQYLFFYWMQYYFDEILKLSTTDGRLYTTVTMVSMVAGMMIGGWLADRIELRFGGWPGRAVVPICSLIGSAVLLCMGILGTEPAWVVTCFALAMGVLGASESSFWVTGIELGRKRGGLSAAILNAGGNAGGILAPVITPLFSKHFGWQAGLGVASVLCIFGALLWWWIDPFQGKSSKSMGSTT